MNEQELLTMGDTLKTKYEELEQKKEKIKEEYLELQKTLISVYGFIRIIDTALDNSHGFYDSEINNFVSLLREFLSSAMENHIKTYDL